MEKLCKACREWLPITEYSFNKGSGTHEARCKECRKAQHREYNSSPARAQSNRKRKAKEAALRAQRVGGANPQP